jgi:ankyrin repeat protein
MRLLLRGCASPPLSLHGASQHGNTPLHYAAERGRLDVAEALLAKGADMEAKDNVRPRLKTA